MMRYLLALLLVGSAAAAIPGTVPVSAPIAPLSTNNVYASHLEQYGQGGYRTVATTNELYSVASPLGIPTLRRKSGMMVRSDADSTFWILGSDLTTWTQLLFAPVPTSYTNTFNVLNQVTDVVYTSGTKTITYDTSGRVATVTEDGRTSTVTYNAIGYVESVIVTP